jgi:diguanylate cyclase (GGDEF)-like protein
LRTWISSVLSRMNLREDLKRLMSFRGQRVLVHEILSLQILITTVIGALAIAALYWGGQWVLQKNYSRWAMQWTEELHELGAPLYLPYDSEVILRLEDYIDKYQEINQVTYFRLDGSRLTSVSHSHAVPTVTMEKMSDELLESVSALVGAEEPYRMINSLLDVQAFEIYAPIWTASIANDGLFDFDPLAEQPENATELVGFVGLGLNFAEFHNNLLKNIQLAIFALIILLIVSGFLGRMSLRRALRAISDLQHPIAELAKGNLAVEFKPAAHREISEIVEALESTAMALGERDAKLLRLANHDSLTGLINRRRFVEELEPELTTTSRLRARGALFFIDLDQFKYVNDTCGHPAGDRLIKKVANCLVKTVGDKGTVARFGGDEFAILTLSGNKRDARNLADQILDDMRQLSHVEDDVVIHVHCSIGITMIKAGEGTQDDIIAQADIACREAKASGRNRAEFYRVSKRETAQIAADVGWMRRIREAIDQDAFLLRYQPIVDIASGETSHHEVLVRLKMEDGQIVSPDMFLPAAIRFGLMAEIDAWMIKHAIEAFALHSQNDKNIRFAINLSSNAFETENLSSYVEAQLEVHGVSPKNIMFEITENLAVRHLSHVEKQITALREMGCEVALDDFGKGYSSLGYLQQLSVDYIKIDGSFIRNLTKNTVDQKMVRLIAEIGREAGMKTIAEYVQSGPAFSLLAELGVDYAQGYYVGKPAAVPRRKTLPVLLSTKRRKKRLIEKARADNKRANNDV